MQDSTPRDPSRLYIRRAAQKQTHQPIIRMNLRRQPRAQTKARQHTTRGHDPSRAQSAVLPQSLPTAQTCPAPHPTQPRSATVRKRGCRDLRQACPQLYETTPNPPGSTRARVRSASRSCRLASASSWIRACSLPPGATRGSGAGAPPAASAPPVAGPRLNHIIGVWCGDV